MPPLLYRWGLYFYGLLCSVCLCPKMSVNNYKHTLHDNPEQWRHHIIQFHINDMKASHNGTEKRGYTVQQKVKKQQLTLKNIWTKWITTDFNAIHWTRLYFYITQYSSNVFNFHSYLNFNFLSFTFILMALSETHHPTCTLFKSKKTAFPITSYNIPRHNIQCPLTMFGV
jgi:hypothetical protein